MRGTARVTNKSLLAPQLLAGAEMKLVLMCVSFWGWVIGGLIAHLVVLVAIVAFAANMYLLRFFAKKDPKGSEVFKRNSMYLLSRQVYYARGFAGCIDKPRKVKTVPVGKLVEL